MDGPTDGQSYSYVLPFLWKGDTQSTVVQVTVKSRFIASTLINAPHTHPLLKILCII